LDDVIDNMAHVALITMFERHLANLANTPIALFLIWD
jgi:hypothetical protein